MKRVYLVFIFIISAFLLSAEPARINGVEIAIKPGVIDLNDLVIRKSDDSQQLIDALYSLKVGDVFIDTDGKAKKVRSLDYDADGNLILDTYKPDLYEVLDDLYIPEQTIVPNIENVALAEGAEFVKQQKRSLTDFDKTIDVDSDIIPPVKLEVDMFTLIKGGKIAGNTISKLKKFISGDKEEKEEDDEDAKKQEELKEYATKSMGAGTKPSLVGKFEIDFDDVKFDIAAKLPSPGLVKKTIKKTVNKTVLGHTFHHTFSQTIEVPGEKKGYVSISADFNTVTTMGVEGKLQASGTAPVPMFNVIIPLGPIGEVVQLNMGVYAETRVKGSVAMDIDYIQEDKWNVGAKGDLHNIIPPYRIDNIKPHKDYSPVSKKIEIKGIASGEVRVGPSITVGLDAWVIPLAAVEVFAGQYTHLDGTLGADFELYPKASLEPKFFGNSTFDTGVFVDGNIGFLERTVVIPLFDVKSSIYTESIGFVEK